MTDKRCVAFYDSGVGGTRLFERTRKAFPGEDYVYFADTKNMPFGDKSEEELHKIFASATKSIISFCPKLLVVACNTMSCVEKFSYAYLPMKTIFVTPFSPERQKTNKSSDGGRKGSKWLLLTTPLTAETAYVKSLISGDEKVVLMPLKDLARDIETWQNCGKKPDISLNFKNLSKDFEYVFLGCTHYGLLEKDFKKIFPNSKIISGEELAFCEIRKFLNTFDNSDHKGKSIFVKS